MRQNRFRGAAIREFRTLFDLGVIRDRDDAQLLRHFLARDGESAELAFAALVERHAPMVLRTCRGILGDSDAAEDAAQAVFLVLLRRAGALRVDDTLGPWLHQVARRVAAAARGAEARRRRHESRKSEGSPSSSIVADRLIADESAAAVHDEVGRLPDRYRSAVILCDLQGLSHEEAARVLDWPLGTVKSRLARGRERLRGRLLRRGLAPSVALASLAVPPGAEAAAVSRIIAKLAAGTIPAGALSLVNGVFRTMLISRIAAAVLALAGGLAAIGAASQVRSAAISGRTPEFAPEFPAPPSFVATDRDDTPDEPPTPWKGGARVDVTHPSGEGGRAAGVIVRSDQDGALVVLPSHTFVTEAEPRPSPGDGPFTIRVTPFQLVHDKFAPELHWATLPHSRDTLDGRLVAIDHENALALVRIRPWRRLDTATLAPADREVKAGELLITYGEINKDRPDSPNDADVSLVRTRSAIRVDGRGFLIARMRVTDPHHRLRRMGRSSEAIACRGSLATSGGLIAEDGTLVGLQTYTDPAPRLALYAPARAIRALIDRADDGSAPDQEARAEAPPIAAKSPRPWETVVRVDVENPDREYRPNSRWVGVVVRSDEAGSIVVIPSHAFVTKDNPRPAAADFSHSIRATLFDATVEAGPSGVMPTVQFQSGATCDGQLVAIDNWANIALIRIRPDRRLSVAPIKPADDEVEVGQPLSEIGFGSAEEVFRVSPTTVTRPRHRQQIGNQSVEVLECLGSRRPLGALFAADGALAGLCLYSDQKEEHGYYAPAQEIRGLLDQFDREAVPVREGEARKDALPAELTRPRPWENAIRLTIPHGDEKAVAMVSGTIVPSEGPWTLVATDGSVFDLPAGRSVSTPEEFKGSITVSRFRGGPDRTGVIRLEEDGISSGHLVAIDRAVGLAIVAITPGRYAPAPPLFPPDRVIPAGQSLITVDCVEGRNPTVGMTTIAEDYPAGADPSQPIECRGTAEYGRDGGGLFTKDGELVGIRLHAAVGRIPYAPARAIRELVVHVTETQVTKPKEPTTRRSDGRFTPVEPLDPTPTAPDEVRRRLEDVEQKLDRILKALEIR